MKRREPGFAITLTFKDQRWSIASEIVEVRAGGYKQTGCPQITKLTGTGNQGKLTKY